jgi:hypothetical protein
MESLFNSQIAAQEQWIEDIVSPEESVKPNALDGISVSQNESIMERRNVQEEMPGSSGENGWKISCGGSLNDDVLVSHTWHRITLLPNQKCAPL